MSEPKKLADILGVALMRCAILTEGMMSEPKKKDPFGMKRQTRRTCKACGNVTRGERFCEECTGKHRENNART